MKFTFEYETKRGPSIPYGRGFITVKADDYDEAEARARRELHRDTLGQMVYLRLVEEVQS